MPRGTNKNNWERAKIDEYIYGNGFDTKAPQFPAATTRTDRRININNQCHEWFFALERIYRYYFVKRVSPQKTRDSPVSAGRSSP